MPGKVNPTTPMWSLNNGVITQVMGGWSWVLVLCKVIIDLMYLNLWWLQMYYKVRN
jgi:hypothetical protein